MNIAQIQKRGLEPMHTDHSRAAAGESVPQEQFSELIRRMLGSGNVSLTEVGFVAPELRIELKEQEQEELKVTEEVVQEDVTQEEESAQTEEEVKVAKEETKQVEQLNAVSQEVVQQVVALERTDRSIKERSVEGVVIDKQLQAATTREAVVSKVSEQVEVRQDLSDGQTGFKGNGNAEKLVANAANGRDDANIKEIVGRVIGKDSPELSMFDESVAPTAPTLNIAPVSRSAAQPSIASEFLHAAIATPVAHVEVGSGEKGSLGNQISAIAGLGDGKGNSAANGKSLKSDLPQKTSSNEMVDKIRELIDQANQSKDKNTISVRIEPADLGVMTVKISQRGDQTTARIIPESAETENLLRGKVNEIVQALQNSGIKAENVNVIIGQEKTEADFFRFAQSSGFGSAGDGQPGLAQDGQASSREKGWMPSAERLTNDKIATKPVVDQGWVA